jgi:hypothetical protein
LISLASFAGERANPPLRGPRLRLEPMHALHAPALFPVISDPALYTWIDQGPPASVERLEAVYRRARIEPIKLPRNAGSWPGYVFTGDPLRLPAGHFGLGHGSGAHAPDEYYVIESTNPKVQGIDGGVRSYVEYLFEVARTR